MLSDREMEILGFFGARLLIRKNDLKQLLAEKGFSDGLSAAHRLSERGYLKFVDAVGSPCYTITQEGLKALKGA